ncbi:hypothetical protein RhiJN_25804 [Ceratobasidium sp. AG-Ba]|nr:hypothetical protein RhiJN_25804 [Ceratobasidium sp. AG-Ba]
MDFARQHGQMTHLASGLLEDQMANYEPMGGHTDRYYAWRFGSCFSVGEIWGQFLFERDVPFHYSIQTLLNQVHHKWAAAWNQERDKLQKGLAAELRKIDEALDGCSSQDTVSPCYAEKATLTDPTEIAVEDLDAAKTQVMQQQDEKLELVDVLPGDDVTASLLANNAVNLAPAPVNNPDDPDYVFSMGPTKGKHKCKLSDTMELDAPVAKKMHPDEE